MSRPVTARTVAVCSLNQGKRPSVIQARCSLTGLTTLRPICYRSRQNAPLSRDRVILRSHETDAAGGGNPRMLQVGICSSVAAFILLCAPGAQAACPDYITAPTGLQYCDIKVGSGDAPTSGAFIKVHYDGRLDSDVASGKFDSSYERGRPLAFAVGTGQVIKGWDQGILGGDGVEPMKAGGKRKLVIPPELGYGARGAGGVIPPNATLYFDVEYLGKR